MYMYLVYISMDGGGTINNYLTNICEKLTWWWIATSDSRDVGTDSRKPCTNMIV